MSRTVVYDEMLGKLELNPETDAWETAWELAPGHSIDVHLHPDEALDAVPGQVKQLLLTLREREPSIREEIARKLIQLSNEDWNPDEQLTEDEFAGRIKLQGVSVSSERGRAELFYDDDDIFAGHAIAVFIDSDGQISEPNLAG